MVREPASSAKRRLFGVSSERVDGIPEIGRKEWLFSNTPGGARASPVMYSIVETASTAK
jgi:hypothetical protein